MKNTESFEIPSCVKFRLNAYEMYSKGSVIWKHPILAPNGIYCSKPSDLDDPRTYTFPHHENGNLMNGENICSLYDGELDWSQVHYFFEQLANEWTLELGNITVLI
ncbi:hypothetical protein Indivirus_1_120 [Indivirus ILV1]|uniref:Uncharacterized protein n=1 Tax=Indivirus ILV1 TaxID=1977633 RepID=A0A1V0SCP9_9VIRU|nr:hypothetical protein Indivirus_1_120 [Indivirus ILV1]